MKLIMTACIDVDKSDFGKWYLTDYEDTDISFEVPYPKSPCDWREIFKNTAAVLGWKTKGFDLDTVEGLLWVLYKEKILGDFLVLEDYFGEIVDLPEGAVIVGGSIYDPDNKDPLLVFWEEDVVAKECLDCCNYTRKSCKGKNRSALNFYSENQMPECFAKCSTVCPYDGECVAAVDYPSDI